MAADLRKKKRSAVFIVVVVSIAVHLFAGAVLAVIKITEVLKEEPEFQAPPLEAVEPPPPPPPPPPTTKRTQKSMPRPQPMAAKNPQDMSVPAIEIDNSDLNMLSGRGFGGGIGDIGGGVLETLNLSAFGFDRKVDGTLTGVLFDFKKDPDGDASRLVKGGAGAIQAMASTWKRFSDSFRIKELERDFFRADTELYASYLIIPHSPASVAPESFGAADQIEATMIGAVYQGTFTPRREGRYRFYGRADDVLIVRLNNRIVLDASYHTQTYSDWEQSDDARRDDEERPKNSYFGFGRPAMSGDWFNFNPQREVDLEIVVSEVPGGNFAAYLLIEKANDSSGPEIFSTIPLTQADKTFLRELHPDAADLLP